MILFWKVCHLRSMVVLCLLMITWMPYVRASRAKGCVVNTSLVMAGGMGIVKKSNPDVLKDDFPLC